MIWYSESCRSIIVLLLFGACLALPANCKAHGTGYRVLDKNYAVSVEFYYSDGEPMTFSKVLLFSPENFDIEYQNGRTDKYGRFSFTPDIQGSWIVEVSDGRGHKVNAQIGVENLENTPQVKTEMILQHSGHKFFAIALGFSIIFNVFGLIALIKRKTAE